MRFRRNVYRKLFKIYRSIFLDFFLRRNLKFKICSKCEKRTTLESSLIMLLRMFSLDGTVNYRSPKYKSGASWEGIKAKVGTYIIRRSASSFRELLKAKGFNL